MIGIVHMGRIPKRGIDRFFFENKVEKQASRYSLTLGKDFYKELLLYDEAIIYFEKYKKWYIQPYQNKNIFVSMPGQELKSEIN